LLQVCNNIFRALMKFLNNHNVNLRDFSGKDDRLLQLMSVNMSVKLTKLDLGQGAGWPFVNPVQREWFTWDKFVVQHLSFQCLGVNTRKILIALLSI
jgi:hypothetical protein